MNRVSKGKIESLDLNTVRRLLRLMELEAVCQKPRLSRKHTEHKIYPYLLRNLDILGAFF